jgi:dTDP-4-dehydrorhamnose reductase
VIAVLGAGGQLGTAFVALLGDRAVPVTRRELDLEQVESIQPWIAANHPDLVINCAAYTAVDAAEGDEQTAQR